MMLFVQNDVLFFFQFLFCLCRRCQFFLLISLQLIFVFSNRRVTTGHTFSATTVKFILFSVVKKLENFCPKRPQNGFQITLRGRIRAKMNHKKLQFWDLCVCTFIEVFVYVFLLVYFFVLGVTQRHRIIQFGVYFLFFFSCYTGTNVLSKTHFSFFPGMRKQKPTHLCAKNRKLRRNSNRKPR